MFVNIVAILMAAAAFLLVGYPLLRDRREEAPALAMPDERERALEDLVAQRDATYAAIKELDFDQEMGNLPEADYRELRERYRRKAAAILRDLDELQEPSLRKSRRSPAQQAVKMEPANTGEDAIEREVLRRRRMRRQPTLGGRPCLDCGTNIGPQDHFCAGCGAPVSAGCPNCGAVHQEGDRFCSRCGATLTGVAR